MPSPRPPLSRRRFVIGGALLAGGAAGAILTGVAGDVAAQNARGPMTPVPIPPQAAAKEDFAPLSGTRLWYWDTGGSGQPVVLLHPASGSALIWGYQQPVFAKADYRVIGYSRRGYYNSEAYSRDNPGAGSEDLHHLIEYLRLGKVHLVASAAGGSIASDYAQSHPDRLLSLAISSNSLGLRRGNIFDTANRIRPKGWNAMPVEFRELGPSYRATDPEGTKLWLELEHKALTGKDYRQSLANEITEEKLRALKVPTLLISGAADLATPPSISRMIAALIPGSDVAVAPEAGHSVYWEQPEIFNKAVLDFISKHSN